ncbi:MAG: homoserine dehydrogenase [Arcanobacterium sp.]|nr:homoserine dehydrogenase [Arcanobacterium sp.]
MAALEMKYEKTVKIALLGAGTVGTQVARLLNEQHDVLSARAGANLQLVGIAVRHLDAPRDPAIDRDLLTDDAQALIAQADIVIELIGGIDVPLALVRYALESGASVVTGNKALLATHGPELYELAAAHDVDLYYEAAVAGAVPVVYGLRESLAGDQVNAVTGILNGTTNFILDEMSTKGLSFEEALAIAQDLGYAEADPSADVDGFDAAAKIAILASLAFHTRVNISDVHVQGIRSITADDIASAQRAGYVIKLIASARRHANGISLVVTPSLVGAENPLASVRGSFNAVVIDAVSADRLMFYGRGAGGAPTASAVLSDVVAAAAKKVVGGQAPRELVIAQLPVIESDQATLQFYIKVLVGDSIGVLSAITRVFADNDVSISSIRQRPLNAAEVAAVRDADGGVADGEKADGEKLAYLTVITHNSLHKNMRGVVNALSSTPGVRRVVNVLRVEED